jgi:capsular polysaccharide biosynthesis protein
VENEYFLESSPDRLERVNEAQPTEELSLRDLYLVLHRWRVFIVVFTVVCIAVALVVSLVMPKRYSSKVTVSLSLLNQTTVAGSGLSGLLLANLPSLTALAQGFGDLLNTRALVTQLDARVPADVYKARFDDKKGVFTLNANGDTPQEATQNAQRLLEIAQNYMQDNISAAVLTNVSALITQSKLDLNNAQENLRLLQQSLKQTPPETRTLETIVPAQVGGANGAISARAVNPAFSTLSIQEANLRVAVAQSRGRIETLTRLQSDPEEIKKLIGQAVQIQVLTPAAEPLQAEQPRPLLYTALAGVLGLLIALIIPFIAEAIRDPAKPRRDSPKRSASSVPQSAD